MSDSTPPVPPVPPADGATPPPAPAAAPPVQPTYPAYGQPAQGYYAPPTNTLAIVALVLAFVVPLGGIICGHIARGQIKRTGEGGDGLALAGLIIGYAFTGLTLLIVIGYAIFFGVMMTTFGTIASTY
jgi:hypothetical protein